MKAADVMTSVTDRLVAAIEAGAEDWQMPWRKLGTMGLPTNATTGVAYRGGNVFALLMTGAANGYTGNRWATFKQWQGAGAQVRKGEHGTHLIYWQPTERDAPTVDGDGAEQPGAVRRGFYKAFVVFNAEQVDGAPEVAPTVPLSPVERLEAAERWFGAIPADIRYGGDRAYFSPALDRVQLPLWDAFASPLHGYATLAHELAHWTGHESRLARVFGKRFGDDAYAAEELVAELSSAFTCAVVGLDTVARTDHAAYLSHWCAMLKADPGILWTVASKAQAATDHLASYVAAAVAVA